MVGGWKSVGVGRMWGWQGVERWDGGERGHGVGQLMRWKRLADVTSYMVW